MEGALIKGGIEEAVQADIEEGQFVQEGGLLGFVLAAALGLKVAGEMLGVAAKGRGGKVELGGQGAVRDRGHESVIDLGAGGVIADGTTFFHTCAPRQEFPHDAGWVQAIRGGDGGPARVGQMTGKSKAKGRKGERGKREEENINRRWTPINAAGKQLQAWWGGRLARPVGCVLRTMTTPPPLTANPRRCLVLSSRVHRRPSTVQTRSEFRQANKGGMTGGQNQPLAAKLFHIGYLLGVRLSVRFSRALRPLFT